MTTNNPIAKAAPAPIGWSVSMGIGFGAASSLILAAEILPKDVAFATLTTATTAAAGMAIVVTHRHLFDLRKLALPAVALMSYLILVAVPAIFVFLDEAGSSRFNYLVAVQSVLVTLPLGVALTEFVLGSSDTSAKHKVAIPDWTRFSRLWDLLFVLAVAIVGLHIYQVGFIPVTEALSLKGDWLAMAVLREESGNLLPGVVNQYLYYWNRILILPGLTILAVGAWVNGQKTRWPLRAVAVFCLAVFHGTFTLEKSFGMIPFLTVGVFLYLTKRQQIKMSYVLSVCLAALVFPLLVLWWIIPEGGQWADLAFSFGKRIFQVPAEVTYSYFGLVPGQMDFLYGKTSKVIAYVTGSSFFDSANYIFRQEFPNSIDTGTSNACFVGTAWANFGWCGVLLEGLLAGILLHVLWSMIRKRRDVFTTSLHALLIIPFTVGFTSSPLETLFLTYAVAPAVAAWAILTHFFLRPAADRAA